MRDRPTRPGLQRRGPCRALRMFQEQRRRRIAIDGLRIEIALAKVTARGAELTRLILGLDPLGDDPDIELLRDLEEALDDSHTGVTRFEAGNETLVDLYDIDRHRQQVRERSIASSEVVQGDPQALGA